MSTEPEEETLSINSFMILLLVLVLVLIAGLSALTYKEPTKEKFNVTTRAGEIYSFDTSHHCKKYLKLAIQQVYGVQREPLNKLAINQFTNVAKDLARIYNNEIRPDRHCDIIKLKVKTVKQIKPKKKEVKK